MTLCFDCDKMFKKTGVHERFCPPCGKKRREKGKAIWRKNHMRKIGREEARELCANLFNAGKNNLPDVLFNDSFEMYWKKNGKVKLNKEQKKE